MLFQNRARVLVAAALRGAGAPRRATRMRSSLRSARVKRAAIFSAEELGELCCILTGGAESGWVAKAVSVEEDLNEGDDMRGPSYRCIIERKGSYLPAKRSSSETKDRTQWDVNAAGLYKRDKKMEPIKKLKHVIIQFDAQSMAQLRLSQMTGKR
ncbi:hypothetical protein B0J14DRAFT_566579 [Halenospora varia]|nr:hypothetical protein B0J14DRAFT_566579 [Halenospora varia]